MAGSYLHAVDDKGRLRSNRKFVNNIENLGDAYELAEEMYGMIWWLANKVASEVGDGSLEARSLFVEAARTQYSEGIRMAPGDQRVQF